jgi:pseudouridine kinase
MGSKIVVIGGTNLDVKGFSQAFPVGGDSNPGKVMTSPGGVARNIAENLARLQREVLLCTVLGKDLQGDLVIAHCRASGIDVSHIQIKERCSTGSYLALMDHEGELALAVSDMTINDSIGEDDTSPWISALKGASLLVLDSNFPERVILDLIDAAALLSIPVLADPVSTAKCGKLLSRTGKLAWIFPNRLEWSAMTGIPVDAPFPKKNPLPCGAIVTLGDEGVYLLPPPASGEAPFRIPAPEAAIRDASGAGDALVAGFAWAMSGGCTIPEAAAAGVAAAALTLESDWTVSPDMDVQHLKEKMHER